MKVHESFRDRAGKDLLFLSISIDPEVDTPGVLRRYRAGFDRDWTGWLHLTGGSRDIEALRWRLGVYDLDPALDADRAEHAGILTFGNDRTDWWAGLPALMDAGEITETISRITSDRKPSVLRPG